MHKDELTFLSCERVIMSATSSSHCPLCAGDGVPLGTLGHLRWFRCRNCGMTYHRQTGTPSKTMSTAHHREGDTYGNTHCNCPESAIEPLAALSLEHLSPSTRLKLAIRCRQCLSNRLWRHRLCRRTALTFPRNHTKPRSSRSPSRPASSC
jgi:rubredoxin